jgi:hypothetical protein
MRVSLIDVDSKIPNLALMQISAYHKSKGHEVGFNLPDPDKVYISCIFEKNRGDALGIKTFYPDADVYIGGSGVNYEWLSKEMQKIKPDYDLYPSDYSLGFTTRGCIRNCSFCIVREKEGKHHRWQHPKEFHDDRLNDMTLLDNNWYADKDWFFETSQWIIDNGIVVVEQGMDIRLLTEDIAAQLKHIKWKKGIKFAFDNMQDEAAVKRGIKILKDVGFNLRSNVQFYVIVGFNTTPEQDKYRCRLLKEMNTNAFVMPFVKNKWTNKIARWANRKWLYWSIDIDDYKNGDKTKR